MDASSFSSNLSQGMGQSLGQQLGMLPSIAMAALMPGGGGGGQTPQPTPMPQHQAGSPMTLPGPPIPTSPATPIGTPVGTPVGSTGMASTSGGSGTSIQQLIQKLMAARGS